MIPEDTLQHLQQARDSSFWWLQASTWSVVIGIVMEGPEIFHDLDSVFDLSTTPVKRWVKLLASLGWLLIVVGVAGEGYFESTVSTGDLNIQAFEHLRVGDIGKQADVISGRQQKALDDADAAVIKSGSAVTAANQASSAAQSALDRSIRAELAAITAKRESDYFERDIVLAKKQATEAESHLADAYNRAASADNRALAAQKALEAYRTGRSLSKEQQDRIAAKLLASKAKSVAVMVGVLPETFEGDKFVESLLPPLAKGWGASSFGGNPAVMTDVGGVSGVMIFPTHTQRSIDAADVLVDAITSEGISAIRSDKAVKDKFLMGCEILPKIKPDDPFCSHIMVVVGVKP